MLLSRWTRFSVRNHCLDSRESIVVSRVRRCRGEPCFGNRSEVPDETTWWNNGPNVRLIHRGRELVMNSPWSFTTDDTFQGGTPTWWRPNSFGKALSFSVEWYNFGFHKSRSESNVTFFNEKDCRTDDLSGRSLKKMQKTTFLRTASGSANAFKVKV